MAVLFSPSSLGLPWDEALRSVLNAFPGAFPILCHGFADNIDWPEVADAGAFHSIPGPFGVAELRQSRGFVWGAKQSSKPVRSTADRQRTRYISPCCGSRNRCLGLRRRLFAEKSTNYWRNWGKFSMLSTYSMRPPLWERGAEPLADFFSA